MSGVTFQFYIILFIRGFMGKLKIMNEVFLPGLLILQKYFPLKAHISLLMTATASKPV